MNCITSGSPAFALTSGRGLTPPAGGSWSASAVTSFFASAPAVAGRMTRRVIRACSARPDSAQTSSPTRANTLQRFMVSPSFDDQVQGSEMLVAVHIDGGPDGFQAQQ